ncbi:hypothetical protein GUITHDRAFT_153304 [Guillardia theta CCMP2712]|uniref:Uncharacterized protein n=1 Tax=Guillardia theta (strain CCMP2712) TaxID=905079 RepID=L1J419_GUITC|nr:hypothetical protein GUITHDRAFT_153304 [Guillardia theta CCMP2712]EKX43261.1 hypothetical protein GUITHDRAFT_153304 [Guillardia theta CCMP2712]|eukprot:XP_005830241.1 hypothetical protein GUITHDRAFT_153304 [Guillardia theta CCMP2712]
MLEIAARLASTCCSESAHDSSEDDFCTPALIAGFFGPVVAHRLVAATPMDGDLNVQETVIGRALEEEASPL